MKNNKRVHFADHIEILEDDPPSVKNKRQRVRFANHVEILRYHLPCDSRHCNTSHSRRFSMPAIIYKNQQRTLALLRPVECFFCAYFLGLGILLLYPVITGKLCGNVSGIFCQITRVIVGLVGCMMSALGNMIYYMIIKGLQSSFHIGCALVTAAAANSIGALFLVLPAESREKVGLSVSVLLGVYAAMCLVTIEPAAFFERRCRIPGERKPCRSRKVRTQRDEEKCEV